MFLLFLASVAGLFPGLTLPIGLGWKQLSVFDVCFVGTVLALLRPQGLRLLDRRLLTAAGAVCGAGCLAWVIHPSPEGARAVVVPAYSMVVLLFAAHLCIDWDSLRRLVLWPAGIALAVAWLFFVVENGLGVSISTNQSNALPKAIHRLGGLSGGSALVLFLSVAAPFTRRVWWARMVILLSGIATISRAMMGLGTATLLAGTPADENSRTRRVVVGGLALGCLGLGLFGYLFAVVPVDPVRRTSLRPSLEPGAYLTLNAAALRMWRESPLLGVGPGRFGREFALAASPNEKELVGGPYLSVQWDAHSGVLGVLAEQGLIGLAAFLWLIIELYLRVLRNPDPEQRRIAAAALTGLLIAGHVVHWIELKGIWLWLGFLVAASGRTATGSPESDTSPAVPVRSVATTA